MGWVVNATPQPLYTRNWPCAHCIGGWVGSRDVLTGVKNVTFARIRSPDRPARSELLYQLRYPGQHRGFNSSRKSNSWYRKCILCSWDRASQIYVNKCPTRCNYTQFILSVNCSTCFGWFLHASSGAQITLSTASGTGQPLLLPVAIVEELRLQSLVLVNQHQQWTSTRCCR